MTAQQNAQKLVDELKKRVDKVKNLGALPVEELVVPNGILDQLANQFRHNLRATQLRRVFHDIKRLEQDARRRRQGFDQVRKELALILPELAYARGRDLIPNEFYELMKSLLNPVNERFQNISDLERLVQILTALLAYHKFHGGR